MTDIVISASKAGILTWGWTERAVAGEAMSRFDVVQVSTISATETTVTLADASAASTANGTLGLVLAGAENNTDGSIASGEVVTILLMGTVYLGEDVTAFTAASHLWLSDTAGSMADAPGTVKRALGTPLSLRKIFFYPNSNTAY